MFILQYELDIGHESRVLILSQLVNNTGIRSTNNDKLITLIVRIGGEGQDLILSQNQLSTHLILSTKYIYEIYIK